MDRIFANTLKSGGIAILAGAALVAQARPLLAQEQPEIPEGSTLEDVQAREKLNEEQARIAHDQVAQNSAAEAEFERRTREVEAEKARIASEQAAAMAAYEAEKARIAREHEEAMAKWKADVEACEKGDKSRCATPED